MGLVLRVHVSELSWQRLCELRMQAMIQSYSCDKSSHKMFRTKVASAHRISVRTLLQEVVPHDLIPAVERFLYTRKGTSVLEAIREADHDHVVYLFTTRALRYVPMLNLFLAVQFPWQHGYLLLDLPFVPFVANRALLYFSHLHHAEHVRALCNFVSYAREVLCEALRECMDHHDCCVDYESECIVFSQRVSLSSLCPRVLQQQRDQTQTQKILETNLSEQRE